MPAEFEPHAGTWMIWPERKDNWRQDALPAQRAFAAVAQAIAQAEPVTMIVSEQGRAAAQSTLGPTIRLVTAPSNDSWARDVGATFLIDEYGRLQAVDWPFNAWGGLYAEYGDDDRIAALMAAQEGCEALRASFVMEGGAIVVDGEGTLVTTASCLLDPNRNPGITRAEIEAEFAAILGAETVIWLDAGIPEDETGGHIDNLLAFAAPGHVLMSWCDDPNDPHHAVSKAALEGLKKSKDARGRSLEITRLPVPGPLYRSPSDFGELEVWDGAGYARHEGARLAASYANFYIANDRVIMPLLDPRTDDDARRILEAAFPERTVVGIESREILLGGGNIHCITQQVPATDGTRP